jgi:hypothetical protein
LASLFEEQPAIKITARVMHKLPRKISRHTLFMIGHLPEALPAYRKTRQDLAALRLAEVTGRSGQIYVSHLPGHSERYLIMPFKEWPQE